VATNVKTNERVAIKKMTITADNMKLLCTELKMMKDSHHPNIVDYIDSFIVDENQLWVVMEYMDGGCLTDVLEQFETVKMTEPQIARICFEVTSPLHIPLLEVEAHQIRCVHSNTHLCFHRH
jgi:serine/threonine protein kinase